MSLFKRTQILSDPINITIELCDSKAIYWENTKKLFPQLNISKHI